MPDIIELRGLRVLAVNGVLPEERERAQPFEIDLDVQADLSAAGRSDALADTVDYGELCRSVVDAVGASRDQLMERLAQRIADAVLATAGVEAVTVSLRKLRPPVPHDLAPSGVRIHRVAPPA